MNMDTFGRQSQAPSRVSHDGDGGKTFHTHGVRLSSPSGGGGHTNHAYTTSSMDDLSHSPRLRQSQNGRNGHENRAYIASISSEGELYPPVNNNSSRIPVYTIPTKDSITHDTNRYETMEIDDRETKDSSCCVSRLCCIIIIVAVALALVGAAVVLGLFFGTDLLQPATPSPTVGSTLTTGPVATTTNSQSTTFLYDISSSTPVLTSTESLMPDGNVFSGRITLNQTWTPDLANYTSDAFRSKAKEFMDYMDTEMSSNTVYSSSYNSTQVLSLLNGSIIVVFRIIFNEPVVKEQVYSQITKILIHNNKSSSLPVIVETLNITDFVEEKACGTQGLILCDSNCRPRDEIACNGVGECSDFYDEFNCPGESVSCNFETSQTCGYTLSGGNFKWIYNRGDTGSLATGPSNDHTYGNSSGHYYYTDWCESCPHGSLAYMESPWFVTREDACFSFFYNMKGHPTEMGPFYLYSVDNRGQEKVLWTRENPDAIDRKGVWRRVSINIKPGSYRFYFTSFHSDESELSDKAIDDILVETGQCQNLPNCDDSLYCQVTNECLPPATKPICNGKFDCPDASDEQQCPDAVYATSFESGTNLTLYSLVSVQSDGSPFGWVIVNGSTIIGDTGTYFDNTFRNGVGHYATMIADVDSTLRINVAFSQNRERCVQFAYQMNNEGSSSSDTSLQVKVVEESSGNTELLWEHEGDAGRRWMHEAHSLTSQDQSYFIEFSVINGAGSNIFVSLDDITVMNGFCPCEDPGRRQCPDRTCIPEEWFCDGEEDCSDGADETNCPDCPAGEYRCNDKSCVKGDNSIRCDGSYDCADGSDEAVCALIDACASEDCIKLSHPEGLLEVCFSQWDSALNDQICTYLYQGPAISSAATQASTSSSQFLLLSQPSASSFMDKFTKTNSCPGNEVVKVTCDEPVCGRPAPSLSPYIIGGTETTQQGRWPWLAGLKFRGFHVCGATILNQHYLATAAHCVARRNIPSVLSVSLGTTQVPPGQPGSVELPVKRVVLHPDFNNVYGGSDIALLYIEQTINYTDFIKPACLANDMDTYSPRSFCYLAGWGKVGLPDEWPDNLQEAKYKLRPYEPCNSSWSGVIQQNMICAGYQSGTIRSCKGDSGGPLMCLDKYKRWNLVGITSFGPGGCLLENQKDDVFTRASKFSDWINEAINFMFTCQNGKTILDSYLLCDGRDDCGDNSDETESCSRTVECKFETRNHCGYTLGGWSIGTGLASSLGNLANTGPSFDHTSGHADGVHLYVYTSQDGGVLTSPQHSSSSGSCLQFFYYLSYDSKITVTKQSGEMIAEVGGGDEVWQIAQVTLPSGDYSIKFKAVILQASYVAIDDVTVTSGACQAGCPSGMFQCSTKFACMPSSVVCDGVFDCENGDDEQNCEVISEVVCSFDEPYACGFRQSDSDDSNWNIHYGYTGSNMAPPSGHTEVGENTDISYIIFAPTQSHATATLVWPLKLKSSACMTFWYYMLGSDIGSLMVSVGGNTVWQDFGDQGELWHRVRVSVTSGSEVKFTAQAGKLQEPQSSNFVAVDDVTVVAGNCPALAECDVATEMRCYSKCLNNTQRCDKRVNCADMSDELSCGWSVDCDFTSFCPSYKIDVGVGGYQWSRNSTGNYLAVDVFNADRGSRTSYKSAPFKLTQRQCLNFKYQITGTGSGSSELRLTLEEPTISRETVMWRSSTATPSGVWTQATATLIPTGHTPVLVSFDAIFGGNRQAHLQLDDIQLSSGSCSLPVCGVEEFLCRYEEKCIPKADKCNGVPDCLAGYDEMECGELAERMSCDFDEDMCEWKQTAGALNLRRNTGPTTLPNTGPSNDNTQESFVGYYLYLDSPSDSAGMAKLTSPTVKLFSQHCFSFYYYMAGADIGYLNLTNLNSTNVQPLVSLYGPQGQPVWHKVKVTLNAADALTLQFLFTGSGRFSNTAIDDLRLREGACDCTDDFKCTTSGECFDSFVGCDGFTQCLDALDEADCADVCPEGSIRCKFNGDCAPIDVICSEKTLECLGVNDTINCNCDLSTEYSCRGICFHLDTFCDGFSNCPGVDELPRCGANCLEGYIACKDKTQCIANQHWCDEENYVDCNDGSDQENGCVPVVTATTTRPPPDCSGPNFICSDRSQVLLRSKYCDGHIDCEDGSDEPLKCECCPDEFTCTAADRCVSNTSRCDGIYDCPDGSDELSCDCSSTQFSCDVSLCLPFLKLCDGLIDCNDGTDETTCNCSSSEFKCNNGRCLDTSLKCNGRDDCLDNSDEFDCPCSSSEVKCKQADGKCIQKSWLCDGFSDCINGTDELNCGSCAEFTCTDYSCISNAAVCDGVNQCPDGSDEINCFSQSVSSMVKVTLSNGSSHSIFSLCYDGWNVEWTSSVCEKLGFSRLATTRVVPVQGLPGPWLQINSTDGDITLSKFHRVNSCMSGLALAAHCQPQVCGVSSKLQPAPYLVSGDIVDLATDWPWMVAIYFRGEFVGAGAYVGDGWVVTAGHLSRVRRSQGQGQFIERRDKNPELFQVELISLKRSKSNLVNVSRVVVHEDFTDFPGLRHDISLFRLHQIPSYPNVCLDMSSQSENLCYVAGWGSVDGRNEAVETLRDARVQFLPDLECISQWNSGGFSIFYPSSMICAGGDNQPSTCFGDSGGPLMCMNTQTARWHLKGIVSFGESNCLLQDNPNVYTDVSAYTEWIQTTIAQSPT